MSSNVYLLLSVAGVLTIAYAMRTRTTRQHLAETPLATALRKPTPEDPKHRAEGTSMLQAAAAVTPAVGVALVVAGSNAVAAQPVEPIASTTATITVVPSSTTPAAADVPDDDIPSLKVRQALLERMRAKKARVSRTVRRTSAPARPIPRQATPVHESVVHAPKPAPHVTPHVTSRATPRVPAQRIVAPSHASAPSETRDRIISTALTQLGLPYVYGAESPGRAFDCSGLTQWVFSKVGINLPRTADAQFHASRSTSTPRPGDLVFYLSGGSAYHVGIYLSPGFMIVAPHTGTVVQKEAIWGHPVYATAL